MKSNSWAALILRITGAPPTNPDVDAGFELFDHTADLGIRVYAGRREDLLWPAVQGLYAAIGELKPSSQAGQLLRWSHEANDPPTLLRDFLQLALLHFERDQKIIDRIDDVEFEDTRLGVQVYLVGLDAQTSAFYREVKAVTYHELSLEKTNEGYEARVIVDI